MLNSLLDQYGRARQDASRKYSAAFEGHEYRSPSICDICDCHVFHQYTLRIVDDRDGLMKYLQQRYSMCYLLSNSLTKAYLDVQRRRLPVTNQLVKEVISLPMHTEMRANKIHNRQCFRVLNKKS
jgi:dTDP-4-amino-4,6-dideoxygalactose transaminase